MDAVHPTHKRLVDEIRARHPDAERIILILDNARYNHAKVVREHTLTSGIR